MPLFQYSYLNERQRKKKAFINADSYEGAREKLLKSNFHILSLTEKKGTEAVKKRCSAAQLILFTKQLRLLISSGLPAYESLRNLEERFFGDSLGVVIRFLSDKLREGIPLSQAMLEYPEFFNDFYRTTIVSGESIGDLEGALLRLEENLTSEAAFKKQLLSSLSYPLTLFLFSLGVIGFFLTAVVPSLQEVFEESGLNTTTRLVFGASKFLCTYKWGLFLGFFTGGGLIFFFHRKWGLKKHVMNALMIADFIKRLIIKLSLGRFFRVLNVLLQGGSNLVTAVAIASRSLNPESLRTAVDEAMDRVVAGGRLSQELAVYPFIPKTVIQMVALGEDTGDLSTTSGYLADIYDEEVRRFLQMFVFWSQPLILVFLGGIIALVMLAVLVPLTGGLGF